MNTKRTKRWNGKIDTLKSDYLTGVIEQMTTYGDRAEFSLSGPGQRPHYQVINTAGKRMAFDSEHRLLTPEDGEFAPTNTTGVLTLDQVKLASTGHRATTAKTRAPRASTSRGPSAATRAKEQIDIEKYEYYKNNRQNLPPEIGTYSEEITTLMRNGMSAVAAFDEVIKQHF